MTVKSELQKLNEQDLREKIVVPLMRAYGAHEVRSWHGSTEKGKDVLYKKGNDFDEPVFKAILLKAKKIDKSVLDGEVKSQIEDACHRPFINPDHPADETRIRGLTIMTNQDITTDARESIHELTAKTFPSIEIVDGDRLSGYIDRILDIYNQAQSRENPPVYYDFSVDSFENFCNNYRNKIHSRRFVLVLNDELKTTETVEGEVIEQQ